VGVEGQTQALFFDIIAAAVVMEEEAKSYRGMKTPWSPKKLPWDKQEIITERFKRQEEIAAKQAQRLKYG